jgi:hypothetical protein
MGDLPLLQNETSADQITGAPPDMLKALQSDCWSADLLSFALPVPIGMAFIVTVYIAATRWVPAGANYPSQHETVAQVLQITAVCGIISSPCGSCTHCLQCAL